MIKGFIGSPITRKNLVIKKAPSYLQYVDTSLVEETKKQLGWKALMK